MGSDVGAKEKDTYRHLGLISNEVINLEKGFQDVASREKQIREMLDGLVASEQKLLQRVGRLDAMVKEAAESAVQEAEREREVKEKLEEERATFEVQLTEKDQALEAKESIVQELQKELTVKADDLEKQVLEKTNLLQIRDAVLRDLESARNALNLLSEGLTSLSAEERVIMLRHEDSAESDQPAADSAEQQVPEVQERMSEEIESLRAEIREKNISLGAREMEIEMLKQKMGGRIEELEDLLRENRKKKPARLAAFLSEIGHKNSA